MTIQDCSLRIDISIILFNNGHVLQLRSETVAVRRRMYRGERDNPTRKDNAAHFVSHELETLRFVSFLVSLCVSVPKLYSISREA